MSKPAASEGPRPSAEVWDAVDESEWQVYRGVPMPESKQKLLINDIATSLASFALSYYDEFKALNLIG